MGKEVELKIDVDKNFLDSLSDAIVVVDSSNNNIVYASRCVARVLAIPREKIIGLTTSDVFNVKKLTDGIFSVGGVKISVKIVRSGRDYTVAVIDRVLSSEDSFSFFGIIGKSNAMRKVFSLIEAVACTDSTVLVQGETGTGKELVSTVIHKLSPRSANPLIKVNCAALPESLLESEVFGYEKGAFTGAYQDKPGKFELADKGTIILDEIGEMPISVQAKLLRVIELKEVERLGSTKLKKIDVRIIATTNRNLEDLVKQGKFREDLFFRLNVFPIYLPPLAERKTDIPLIAEHFMKILQKKLNGAKKELTQDSLDILMNYHWPGNVREVENVLERAYILSTADNSNFIDPEIIKNSISNTLKNETSPLEKEIILSALKSSKTLDEVSSKLKMHRTTVWRKLKMYGIVWKKRGK